MKSLIVPFPAVNSSIAGIEKIFIPDIWESITEIIEQPAAFKQKLNKVRVANKWLNRYWNWVDGQYFRHQTPDSIPTINLIFNK